MTKLTCDSCGGEVAVFAKVGTSKFPERLKEVCGDCHIKIEAQLEDITRQLREYEEKLKAKL